MYALSNKYFLLSDTLHELICLVIKNAHIHMGLMNDRPEGCFQIFFFYYRLSASLTWR